MRDPSGPTPRGPVPHATTFRADSGVPSAIERRAMIMALVRGSLRRGRSEGLCRVGRRGPESQKPCEREGRREPEGLWRVEKN